MKLTELKPGYTYVHPSMPGAVFHVFSGSNPQIQRVNTYDHHSWSASLGKGAGSWLPAEGFEFLHGNLSYKYGKPVAIVAAWEPQVDDDYDPAKAMWLRETGKKK